MADTEKKTVLIICGVPNGLTARTFRETRAESGLPHFVPTGDACVLKAGENEVDAEFAATWFEQNAESDLVKQKIVTFADDEGDATQAKES